MLNNFFRYMFSGFLNSFFQSFTFLILPSFASPASSGGGDRALALLTGTPGPHPGAPAATPAGTPGPAPAPGTRQASSPGEPECLSVRAWVSLCPRARHRFSSFRALSFAGLCFLLSLKWTELRAG